VYGWLSLDRRGNWRIKGQRIGNPALREFIGRNYEADSEGRWYFQNGPQRVYVTLAYTPLVVHYEGGGLVDHCARPFKPDAAYQDEEGAVLFSGAGTIALLDDRDLLRFADEGVTPAGLHREEIAGRYRFIADPGRASSL
jgi:hypothetical protein